MDTARYYIALLLLLTLPPPLLLWVAIHPFARFWRRLGPGWTYALLLVPAVLLAAGLFRMRRRILAVEYGTSYLLVLLAVVFLGAAGAIAWARRRQLTFRILAGIPELSAGEHPGKLLTEGIYGRIRHPRYVEIALGLLGYALFANYLALYVIFGLSLPTLFVIVLLEERELRDRFGAEYEEYLRRVPRFFPRGLVGS